jgi:hypothetical protein
MKPCVAPLKRPSVIRAIEPPSPRPTSAAGYREHLAHARAARWAFISDHDDIAGRDPAGLHCRKAFLFTVEHARRPFETQHSGACQLQHAAFRSEVAIQDRVAAARLHWRGQRPHDLLVRRPRRRRGQFIEQAAPGHGWSIFQ